MKAAVGDRVFVATDTWGHARMGRIVALRHPDGTPPYVVRWADTGHEEVYFPRSGGVVDHVLTRTAAPLPTQALVSRTWTVDLSLVQDGQTTTVRAILHEDCDDRVVRAEGHAGHPAHSAQGPRSPDSPHEDEVAVAQALSSMADLLAGHGRPSSSSQAVDLTAAALAVPRAPADPA